MKEFITVLDVTLWVAAQVGKVHVAKGKHRTCIVLVLKEKDKDVKIPFSLI